MFSMVGYRPSMPDAPHLRPATPDEIADALSFALRYQGRKRVHHADDAMARITADRLVQHLEASGFVLMKGPPRDAPTTTHMRAWSEIGLLKHKASMASQSDGDCMI
jgi:hypothetical protein